MSSKGGGAPAKPGRKAAQPGRKHRGGAGPLELAPSTRRWRLAPADAHEWMSFEDPVERRTWRFDVTFLLSHWECIYGRGCQGVLTGLAPEMAEGCCSYGAHFTDAEDEARVKAAARTLSPEQWQFAEKGRRGGVARHRAGQTTITRLVEGACIFLNRPGFPGGPGCALHRAALERGESPMALKPDVCWQLPLRREDQTNQDGSVTSTVCQWERAHWGAGGDEFAWWCTEAPEAFRGREPVWRHMRAELLALVGPDVLALLQPYLEERERAGAVLPHPAVRPGGSDRSSSKGTPV
ncbi:MAG: hypothetical protein ACRDZX_01295 [Acidimicrobiales bacterium]